MQNIASASFDGAEMITEIYCERPLLEWRDVGGSKLRPTSAVRALVALKATVITNRREIAAEEFFTGALALGRDPERIIPVRWDHSEVTSRMPRTGSRSTAMTT